MKFTTNQQDLAPILVHLSRITSNLLPNVQLTASTDTLTLYTSDCSVYMSATIPAVVEEAGTVTMDCKELSALINRLTGKVNYDNGIVKANGSKFKFVPTQAEMPVVPILEETPITVDAKELITQLKKTLIGAAPTFTGNLLSGILLDGQNVVATDGNMMIVNRLSAKLFDEQVILPSKLVDEMTKCFANANSLSIATNGRNITISSDTMTITSTLLEGQYPKYAQLIPQSYTKKAVLNAKELLQHVSLIELAANQKTNICKMAFTPDNLTLSANKDGCEGDTCMDIESTDELNIAFNIAYLLKILKNYDSDVIEFSFDGSLSAGLFKPNESDLALLMPCQIRS